LAVNERLVIDPKICHGKPVIGGTRTTVTVVLDVLAGAHIFETLMEDYRITIEDIRDCIALASQEISQQSYHTLPV